MPFWWDRVFSLIMLVLTAVGAQAQSVTRMSDLQAQLNAFLAIPEPIRPPIFSLPNGYILADRTLIIPPGVRNVRFVGGPNTVFIRTTANPNFQFISAGSSASFGLSNAELAALPNIQVQPITKGQTQFVPIGTQAMVPGWYLLYSASQSPLEVNPDLVRLSNGAATHWYRRELVYVNAGNPPSFSEPAARNYLAPFLARMDGSVSAPSNAMCENISFENFTLDGKFEGILPFRANLPKNYPTRLMTVGLASGVTIRNVTGRNYLNSGIRLNVVRNFLVEDVHVENAVGTSLLYGIELTASRLGEIRRITSSNVRLAIATGSGTSNLLVRDCKFDGATAVDLSHGQGETEITYLNVLAGLFQIGNTSWPAGGENLRMVNCSAIGSIEVKPNVRGVHIVGRYLDTSVTPPLIYPTAARLAFFSNGSSAGIPSGPVAPGDTLVEDAVFEMGPNNQVPPIPSAGFVLVFYQGGASPVPRLNNITFRNTVFRNALPITQSASTTTLGPWAGSLGTNPPRLVFEGCSFFNVNGFSPVSSWSGSTDGTPFDMRFTDCAFYTNDPGGLAISRALRFGVGSSGNVTLQRVTFNKVTRSWTLDGSPTDNAVLNEGSVTLTYLP